MNKKVLCIIITVVITALFLSTAIAQVSSKGTENSKKDFRFTVKTNPLSALGGPFWVLIVPLSGEYKLLGEVAISKKISFQAGISYIGPSVLINLDKIRTDTASGFTGIKTSGIKVSGMLKFFLSRDLQAPHGFYIGPHVSYASAKLASKENANNYVGATKLNMNIVIGYQMITSGGFTLDLFTGMGFVKRDWTFHGQSQGELDLGGNKSAPSIPLGVSFGYAF